MAVLREGGAAVDAAIAAQAVLTLVEPQSSGIGGGALMLHWDAAARRLSAWDGREVAPASATPELFLRDGQADAVPRGGGRRARGRRAGRAADAGGGAPRRMAACPGRGSSRPRSRWPRRASRFPRASPRRSREEAERLGRDPAARALFLLPDGSPLPRRASPAQPGTGRDLARGGRAAAPMPCTAGRSPRRSPERCGRVRTPAG